jgi:hypothetical protein
MSRIAHHKTALQRAIRQNFTALQADYQRLPVEICRQPLLAGNRKGLQISVCDSLAYLIGWATELQRWIQDWQQGLPLQLPAPGYQWHQLGALAEHFYAQQQNCSIAELLARYQAQISDLQQQIEQFSESQLYGSLWYRNYSLGRMIQLNTAAPMHNVRCKIRTLLSTSARN